MCADYAWMYSASASGLPFSSPHSPVVGKINMKLLLLVIVSAATVSPAGDTVCYDKRGVCVSCMALYQ